MFMYSRRCSFIFKNLSFKRSNFFTNPKISYGNKSFYSNFSDNRLKSSLESIRFTKKIKNGFIFPRYDQVNSVLNRFNIALVSHSLDFSTASSNIIELTSDDQALVYTLPTQTSVINNFTEMTDEAIPVKSKVCISETECSSKDNEDVICNFKGHPQIGKEYGSVYTKHEPTMFGDWSHMGRVTDF
ncbi:uncharacterized protein TA19415 [Theileria annulata]|uniref:Succinate dehydrogenase assembly factor 4, mitochondrial n=1 Tax=Theileria annulata TaxID=5874 RepID=Q4UGF3_THEAN|nr:uncharacterized protein TA19415 [Theileria annulata]CAI73836.1 hypothetical protein TA19415 [Theileria annulata]|eukprot:XP_954513.1 hypothetical protein TA19415 [Theileria annulata]